MRDVVMAPDMLLAIGLADAFDHRGVVERVGIDDEARQNLAQRRQRRLVGDITGGEEERGFLLVQLGQRALEFDMVMRRAGNIAGPARARADIVERLLHRADHARALAHGEIIVRAPDRHVAHFAGGDPVAGARKAAPCAQQIGEDAIASLGPNPGHGRLEGFVIIHCRFATVRWRLTPFSRHCHEPTLASSALEETECRGYALKTLRKFTPAPARFHPGAS